MKELLVEALEEVGIELLDAKICVLGYAFLENSDDTRNTPSKQLYDILKDECSEIVVHDPYVEQEGDVLLSMDLEGCLKDKDAVLLVTKHNEYSELDPKRYGGLLANKIIIDGRNVYTPEDFIKEGFVFRGIGKGTIYRKSDS